MPSLVGDNGIVTFDDLLGDAENVDDLYARSLKERQDSEGTDYLLREAERMGMPLDVGSDTDSLWTKAWDTTKWVAGGVPGLIADTPDIAMGGISRGIENTLNFPGAVANFAAPWLNKNLGSLGGGLQFTDPQTGQTDIKWLGPEEWAKFEAAGGKSDVPEADLPLSDMQADTPVGALMQSFVQYLVGLGAVSKVTGGIGQGYSFGGLAKRLGQYSLADVVAWDGQEGNLGNLIQSFPALQNPVTEFLATDKTTPEAEGRFKNALAGLPFNVLTEPLLWWLNGIKAARTVKGVTDSQSLDEAFKKLGVESMDDAMRKVQEMKAAGGRYPSRLPRGGVADNEVAQAADNVAPQIPPSLTDDIVGNPDDDLIRSVTESMGDKSLTPQAVLENADTSIDNAVGAGSRQVDAPANAGAVTQAMEQGPPPQEGGAAPPGQPPGTPPAMPPDGQPPAPQPRFSDRVNWSKIETDANMQEAARALIDQNEGMLKAQGYGTRIGWVQTEDAAKSLPVIDMLVKRGQHAGRTLDAAQMRAAGQIFTQAMVDLEKTARIAASPNHTAQDLINFEHMQRIFTMAQNLYLPATSEVGRSLNILKKVQKELGGNYRQQVDLMLERMGGAETMEAKAAALVDIFEHVDDPKRMIKAARGLASANTGAAVREIWINSIFSARTLLRNIIGNTATTALAIPERKVAEVLGKLDPIQGAAPGEAMQLMRGYIASQPEALTIFWRAFKAGGEVPPNMLEDVGGSALSRLKLEHHPFAMSAKAFNMEDSLWARGVDVLGTLLTQGRWKTRLMGATDAYYKVMLARGQQYAVALREATHEVERGLFPANQMETRWAHWMANPSKKMTQEIAEFAAEGTFTKDPTKGVKAIQKAISSFEVPIVGRPLQFVVPFIPTPANLFKYGAERSPAALIMKSFREEIAAGGVRRDTALGKLAIGSMLIGVAYQLGLKGYLSPSGKFGGTDDIVGKRQLEQRRNKIEYAVRLPWTQKEDGTWVTRDFSMNGMAPVTFWLGLGADLAAYAKNAETQAGDRDFLEAWSTAVFSLAATQLDQSFFYGAAQLMDAINEPERYGEYFWQNLATSFIPAEVRDTARAMDPTLRHAHDMTTKLLSKVPGMGKDIPPRLDLWGRERKSESGFGWAYDVMSPSYSKSSENNQPIDEELAKLEYYPMDSVRISLTGTEEPSSRVVSLRNLPQIQYEFRKFAGRTPADKVLEIPMTGPEGEETTLRDLMMATRNSSYRRAVRILDNLGGQDMLGTLNALVTGKHPQSREYLEADVEDKKQAIRDIISAFRAAARVKVVAEHPELQEVRDRMYRKGEGYLPQFTPEQLDGFEQETQGAP